MAYEPEEALALHDPLQLAVTPFNVPCRRVRRGRVNRNGRGERARGDMSAGPRSPHDSLPNAALWATSSVPTTTRSEKGAVLVEHCDTVGTADDPIRRSAPHAATGYRYRVFQFVAPFDTGTMERIVRDGEPRPQPIAAE